MFIQIKANLLDLLINLLHTIKWICIVNINSITLRIFQ